MNQEYHFLLFDYRRNEVYLHIHHIDYQCHLQDLNIFCNLDDRISNAIEKGHFLVFCLNTLIYYIPIPNSLEFRYLYKSFRLERNDNNLAHNHTFCNLLKELDLNRIFPNNYNMIHYIFHN